VDITFVVRSLAGSATYQLARALGQSVTEQTKQAVVVDNKAGASGMMAAQAAARAPADGYAEVALDLDDHLRDLLGAAHIRSDALDQDLVLLGHFVLGRRHATWRNRHRQE